MDVSVLYYEDGKVTCLMCKASLDGPPRPALKSFARAHYARCAQLTDASVARRVRMFMDATRVGKDYRDAGHPPVLGLRMQSFLGKQYWEVIVFKKVYKGKSNTLYWEPVGTADAALYLDRYEASVAARITAMNKELEYHPNIAAGEVVDMSNS